VSGFVWTAEVIRRATGASLVGGPPPERFAAVRTDTRDLSRGDLFVALRGERFDAHEMLGRAAEAGAAAALVSRIPDDAPDALPLFVVDDTLTALASLARHRRRAHGGRVVAVAGSNGKTTTKDLLATVLGARYRVHATGGNFNNQVGLPLTLFAAPEDAEVLVLEIGTNTPGEIAILASIAEPDALVITSIAEEHLEKLVDLEGVLIEETSALLSLPRDGFALVAEEPAELPARTEKLVGPHRFRTAGLSEGAALRPDGGEEAIGVREDGTTEWSWRGHRVHLPLRGRHNVRNALLALGIAEAWGVEPAAAVEALRSLPTPKLRGEWVSIGGVRVIADCYNSNPASLTAAVDLLASLPEGGEKVAVLGTMKEMGAESDRIHARSAAEVAGRVGAGIDRVVATGDFVPAFAPLAEELGDRLVAAEDVVEAYERVAPTLRPGATLLLKGSRGVALERWLDRLREEREPGSSPEAREG